MKIIVTGGSGKLGQSLKKILGDAIFPDRLSLDICNFEKTKRYLSKNTPEIIIHTAALTDVRLCEKDKKLAWETNYQGTLNLIRASENLNNKPYFIYISTACVFDGINAPFTEDDIPNPQNFYALTKLLGENSVLNSHLQNKLIIRTNFIDKSPWPYKMAFKDRFGTYLFTDDVAMAILDLIDNKKNGIIHLTGNKKMSMYELAKIVSPNILPMTFNDYVGPKLTVDMSLKTINWKPYKISI